METGKVSSLKISIFYLHLRIKWTSGKHTHKSFDQSKWAKETVWNGPVHFYHIQCRPSNYMTPFVSSHPVVHLRMVFQSSTCTKWSLRINHHYISRLSLPRSIPNLTHNETQSFNLARRLMPISQRSASAKTLELKPFTLTVWVANKFVCDCETVREL